MTISGTALLALCTLIGAFLGEALGSFLHVKANVGGVGLGMLLLIATKAWLHSCGILSAGITRGVGFWALMYIPIVVAMAAQQNVLAALDGGPMVLLAGCATVILCFILVGILGHLPGRSPGADHD